MDPTMKLHALGQPDRGRGPDGLSTQASGHVYKLYRPSEEKSQILVFHDLQSGVSSKAYLTTLTNENTVLWPAKWLPDRLPQAHILSASYDASGTRTTKHGRLDSHCLAESLTYDIDAAKICQTPDYAVIPVGHSFGGQVIKKLSVQAHEMYRRPGDNEQKESFLKDLGGVFFYATPRCGTEFVKFLSEYLPVGPSLEYVTSLNAKLIRLHEDLLSVYKNLWPWKIASVEEENKRQWNLLDVVIAHEASATGGQVVKTIDADHLTTCQSTTNNLATFKFLLNFIRNFQPKSLLMRQDSHLHLRGESQESPRPPPLPTPARKLPSPLSAWDLDVQRRAEGAAQPVNNPAVERELRTCSHSPILTPSSERWKLLKLVASALLGFEGRGPPPEARSPVSEVELQQVERKNDGGHSEIDSPHPESTTFVIKRDFTGGDERVDVAKVGQNPGLKLLEPPVSSPLELIRPAAPWTKGERLGSGSYGSVYCAVDSKGNFFAVKEVSLIEQDKIARASVDQLKQEIDLLSHFRHENIVQYLGTERADGKLYIFLELVSQGSLAAVYRKFKLSESQISNYTREILNGLKYLHDRRIVHRDIKCANILVDTRTCKLADFGMAKQISNLDANKSCKGSAFWMAPEVIDPKKTYGPPSDIWSLGCSVLEMATQSHPFTEMEPVQVFWHVGNGNAPPIPDCLSPVAKDFIRRCFEINATKRSTAAELLQHEFVQQTPDSWHQRVPADLRLK